MPAIARIADVCTGHGCWPSRPNDQGSANVFINGRAAHRVGDHWMAHTCPIIPETHDSILAQGSSTVFVNGKPLGRIGDAVACGSFIRTGSPDVYAGG